MKATLPDGMTLEGSPEEIRAFYALPISAVPIPSAPPSPVQTPHDQTAMQTQLALVQPDPELDAIIPPNKRLKRKCVRIFDALPASGYFKTGTDLLARVRRHGVNIVSSSPRGEIQQLTDALAVMEKAGIIVREAAHRHYACRRPGVTRADAILALAQLKEDANGKLAAE